MKKTTFLAFITLLFFNSVNAQVLWSEDFDNFVLGNVGTDVTGTIPGQGNWYTRNASKLDDISNENFKIEYEAGRGKYLILKSTMIDERVVYKLTSRYIKKDIGSVWSLRDTVNNILKIEFEYNYYFYPNPNSGSGYFHIKLTNNQDTYGQGYQLISCLGCNGLMYYSHNGAGNVYALPNLIANPNSWHKMIIYVDIDNDESYIEFPFKNYVVKSHFKNHAGLSYNPLDLNSFDINFTSEDNFYGQSFLKVDNIKISAINILPTLNIIDLDASKFNLYPNPATNIVNISNNENISVKQVEIYNVAGKLIDTQHFTNEAEIQLNIETLTSGTYMLHLQTEEGTAVKKLIKK